MTTGEHSEPSQELEEFQSSMPQAALFSDLEVLPGGEGFCFSGMRILCALSMEPMPSGAPLCFINCALDNYSMLTVVLEKSDCESPDFYRLVNSLPFESEGENPDEADPVETLALRAERIDRLAGCLKAAESLSHRLPPSLVRDTNASLLEEIRTLCANSSLKTHLFDLPVASVPYGPRCIPASGLGSDEKEDMREPIQFVSPCFSGLSEGRPVMLIRTTMSDERKVLLWIRGEEDFPVLSSRFMGWEENEREAWCSQMRSRLQSAARCLRKPHHAPLAQLAVMLCEHAESLFDLMPDEPAPASPGHRQILRGEAASKAWNTALEGLFSLFAAVDDTVRNKLNLFQREAISSPF